MYRRKVKDVLSETVDKCRQVILEALRKIKKENKEAYLCDPSENLKG